MSLSRSFSRLTLSIFFLAALSHTADAQSVINDYANESAQASAQRQGRPKSNEWTGFVAAGAAILPEYDGAEDYQAIPILAGQLNKGNYYIATRGLGVAANVINSRHFNAGPVVNFRFGRDDDVGNNVIAQLRPIDDAVEVGAFASYIFRDTFAPNDNLELSVNVTQDAVDAHGGLLGEIGASYFVPVRRDLRVGINASLNYQSEDYMDQYFSIDADNNARSGLAQFDADGGFNSAGIGGMVLYSLTPRWGVVGIARYTQWMGDAADSPIIDQEGSEGQFFTALGVTYRF